MQGKDRLTVTRVTSRPSRPTPLPCPLAAFRAPSLPARTLRAPTYPSAFTTHSTHIHLRIIHPTISFLQQLMPSTHLPFSSTASHYCAFPIANSSPCYSPFTHAPSVGRSALEGPANTGSARRHSLSCIDTHHTKLQGKDRLTVTRVTSRPSRPHHCLALSPPSARLRSLHAHCALPPTHPPSLHSTHSPPHHPPHHLHSSNNSCHLLTSPSVVPPPTTAPSLSRTPLPATLPSRMHRRSDGRPSKDQPNTGSARRHSLSCIDTHHTKLQGKDRLTVTRVTSRPPAHTTALPSRRLPRAFAPCTAHCALPPPISAFTTHSTHIHLRSSTPPSPFLQQLMPSTHLPFSSTASTTAPSLSRLLSLLLSLHACNRRSDGPSKDQPNTGSARRHSLSCIDTHHTKLQGKDRLTVTRVTSRPSRPSTTALPSRRLPRAFAPCTHTARSHLPIRLHYTFYTHPPPHHPPHHLHSSNNSCHLLTSPSVVPPPTTAPSLSRTPLPATLPSRMHRRSDGRPSKDQPNTGSARRHSLSCIDTHHTKLQGKDRLTVTRVTSRPSRPAPLPCPLAAFRAPSLPARTLRAPTYPSAFTTHSTHIHLRIIHPTISIPPTTHAIYSPPLQ
ncbi:hypothetical protein ECG_09980 [Echinococcus granulosus]|nr:hypothetical protein ECG_09980 [Echinococcus granulosus]